MARIIERDGSTGYDWCCKKKQKTKNLIGGKGQTPGRQKGADCQATPQERFMAKRNRSYKHKSYSQWSASHTGKKKGG